MGSDRLDGPVAELLLTMADRESTAVGYRLRMQPADLSTYPDSVKLVWFEFVVKYGLLAKFRDLRRGKDKDGNIHPLRPRTIKYRRSEVGPVTKTAPRGIPALDLSRVISLLTGRAHTSSAEFWWGFDSHTGRSFAEILHFWSEKGHDVFGLSQAGRDWTLDKASQDWDRWLASPAAAKLLARPGIPGAKLVRKTAVRQPIRTVEVRRNIDLSGYDLSGDQSQLKKAIEAGQFSGFRRLNARGEQWKPGPGFPAGPPPPRPQIAGVPKPAPKLAAVPGPVTPASVKMTPEARVQELSQYTTSMFGVQSHVISVEDFTARFAGAAIDKARAAYDPKTQAIWWNVGSPAWVNPAKHFETQRKEKFLVDPSPMGVAHHEVGHARLHAELIRRYGLEEGTRRYWMLARDEFKDENEFKQRLKKVASRLAAIDKNEFVAEIYSGLVIGRTYPAEVLALYDELGGMRPNVPG